MFGDLNIGWSFSVDLFLPVWFGVNCGVVSDVNETWVVGLLLRLSYIQYLYILLLLPFFKNGFLSAHTANLRKSLLRVRSEEKTTRLRVDRSGFSRDKFGGYNLTPSLDF